MLRLAGRYIDDFETAFRYRDEPLPEGQLAHRRLRRAVEDLLVRLDTIDVLDAPRELR